MKFQKNKPEISTLIHIQTLSDASANMNFGNIVAKKEIFMENLLRHRKG